MIEKFNRRLVKVTKHHAEEAKELLKLMGVPYVDAPCEAEAECAALVRIHLITNYMYLSIYSMNIVKYQVRAGKVYAAATEDMDALTFGSGVLLRHMTFSEARKMPVQEFHLDRVLEGLAMSKNEVYKIAKGLFILKL